MKPAHASGQLSRVSVVIITHNREQELQRAVLSVLSQTHLPLEIIVVDDGSTPPVRSSSLSVDENTAAPVRLIRNQTATGPAGARNRGIAEASGEWIAFLDDDDEFYPDKIASIEEALREAPERASVLYHPARITMVNEGVDYVPSSIKAEFREQPFMRLLVKNTIGGTPMVVVRKSALTSVGMFDTSLQALEDYELWLRLAKAGYLFRLIDRPLTKYNYTTAKASITKSEAAGIATFQRIRSLYALDFEQLGKRERMEHEMWIHEVELHRAILRLRYMDTFKLSSKLLLKHRRLKYFAAMIAALFGPRAIIRLRARNASRGDTPHVEARKR